MCKTSSTLPWFENVSAYTSVVSCLFNYRLGNCASYFCCLYIITFKWDFSDFMNPHGMSPRYCSSLTILNTYTKPIVKQTNKRMLNVFIYFKLPSYEENVRGLDMHMCAHIPQCQRAQCGGMRPQGGTLTLLAPYLCFCQAQPVGQLLPFGTHHVMILLKGMFQP